MKSRKLLSKAIAGPANLRFAEFQQLAQAFGFRLLRVSGSHHIYGRDGIAEQVNMQNVRGRAKPYQVRQFLQIIERYNLHLQENT